VAAYVPTSVPSRLVSRLAAAVEDAFADADADAGTGGAAEGEADTDAATDGDVDVSGVALPVQADGSSPRASTLVASSRRDILDLPSTPIEVVIALPGRVVTTD
jgi:hypothetical protein